MRGLASIAALAAMSAIACSDSPPAIREAASSAVEAAAGSPPAGDPARGRAWVAQFECSRCHELPEVPAAGDDKHCVRCHQQIEEGGFHAAAGEVSPSLLAEWRRHIVSLRFVPPLDRGWLRRDWVVRYLTAPRDLRPHLVADMPRLDLDARQAADIAAFLGDGGAVEAAGGDVAAGRARYQDLGCASCHRFGGAGVDEPSLSPRGIARGQALAPDLRHTRARVAPQRLVAWLLAPDALRPGGAMPAVPLDERQARDLVAFITRTPLAPETPPAPAERLPLLDREVTFDEVSQRVFRKVCWHCHAQPDYARGDGGPGKSGGFGFAARELDLSSYEAIASGYLDREGHMQSLFAPTRDGTPVLVAALLARQHEERGRYDDALRGMPLGLPSLPPEDIQLVESWIAQGRRR